jgi:hypothetical protein
MLDLSNNVIAEVADNYAKNRFKVDQLLMRENQIRLVGKSSFKNFLWINYTSLEGNPAHTIGRTAQRERALLLQTTKDQSYTACS